MRKLAFALGLLILSGCANHPLDCSLGISHADCLPGTRGYEQRQHNFAEDRALCIEYGFREGTNEYAQCRMALDQADASRRQEVMQQYFSNLQRQQSPATPQTTITTTCTSQEIYDQTQMRCVSRTD